MDHSLLSYFTDPVLKAPTLGSILMCLSASLVGVLVYLRKESLIGEALSHATYPGVILGAWLFSFMVSSSFENPLFPAFVMGGAGLTGLVGIFALNFLTKKLSIRSDAALCFVLSAFFGAGVFLASQMQFTHTLLYKQSQVYIWGQTATMTDSHVKVYLALFILTAIPLLIFYKEFKAITFDRVWATTFGLPVAWMDRLLFVMIVLSLVTGIRSVGVVLVTAMLIQPAVAARQFTDRMGLMFILSALFGGASAFLGNVLSFEFSQAYDLSFPTGPMIVLVSSAIALFSLLFAPKRGIVMRRIRQLKYRLKALSENTLKTLWRLNQGQTVTFKALQEFYPEPAWVLKGVLSYLAYAGWVRSDREGNWTLSREGAARAEKIIRLHRLW
jgi:manganese/zinc/iron transport system permease protein